MKFKSRILRQVAAITLIAATCHADEAKPSVIRDGDRIVFLGDSITGQGGNSPQGWTGLMAESLADTHPAGAPTLIALGGSGQTVGSWQNVEKKSRDVAVILDVKGVDVKTTLDQPADVVVIMLGMNDVLSPSLSGDEKSFDGWQTRYSELIASIRERTKPRLFALATVPLCTEDENSPKNQAIAELTKRISNLAQKENAIVLPVHQSMLEMLAQGRTLLPNFHVTNDFVHPNFAGHLAIAQGMLKGLGEPVAAQSLTEKYIGKAWGQTAESLPALSYSVEYLPSPPDSDQQTCKIHYFYTSVPPHQKSTSAAPQVRLTVPNGWKVTPAISNMISGEFTVSGPFDRLNNQLTLEASGGANNRKTEISLPAPWLIGTANLRQIIWLDSNSRFDPVKGQLAIDDTLINKGEGWGKPADIAPDRSIKWSRYNPSVNYIGGAQSGSVDMSAVTYFQSFEVSHGARWIYSTHERTVSFKLGSQSFGGNDYLGVWMNGQSIYSGHIMKERGKVVETKLNKGWNALVFKSNHLQSQWHFTIDLVPTDTDDLSDLRVSIVPRNP